METKKKILAIDDSMQQINIFQGILGSKYIFRAAKSGSEAFSFLSLNVVDLVLLDIEMPTVSGFEFFEDIKKIPSYKNVPVIIVSSKTGEDFMRQVKESGAFGFLNKPVVPELLLRTIEKALAITT